MQSLVFFRHDFFFFFGVYIKKGEADVDLSPTKKEITVGLDKRDDECSLPSSFLGRKIESLVDVM